MKKLVLFVAGGNMRYHAQKLGKGNFNVGYVKAARSGDAISFAQIHRGDVDVIIIDEACDFTGMPDCPPNLGNYQTGAVLAERLHALCPRAAILVINGGLAQERLEKINGVTIIPRAFDISLKDMTKMVNKAIGRNQPP